jgi:phosphoglucomutase
MSTPACSAYIRYLNSEFGNCLGGVLLTASHNPGGPHEDFGIKFNSRNGGPAQEEFTNLVHAETTRISEFVSADLDFLSKFSLSTPGSYHFTNVLRPSKPVFTVKVVESVGIYVQLMKSLFDF